MISTRNANDTGDLTKMKFLNTNEMAEELKTLARTNDPRIGYIDVCMPVPFQQVQLLVSKKEHYRFLQILSYVFRC